MRIGVAMEQGTTEEAAMKKIALIFVTIILMMIFMGVFSGGAQELPSLSEGPAGAVHAIR